MRLVEKESNEKPCVCVREERGVVVVVVVWLSGENGGLSREPKLGKPSPGMVLRCGHIRYYTASGHHRITRCSGVSDAGMVEDALESAKRCCSPRGSIVWVL